MEMMLMEEMQFEEMDDGHGQASKQGETLQMFAKQPNRGPAVKSGRPAPSIRSTRYEQIDDSTG